MLKKLIIICVLIISADLSAQDADSLKTTDSTQTVQPIRDTLNPAQSAYQGFLDRQKLRQQEIAEVEIIEMGDYISFYDSLTVYLLSKKLSQRSNIREFSYRDAGDYFRYMPSAFVLDYHFTPMRKTVQPFSLSGDRTNFISNGLSIHPFEHFLEPDGLVDFNDIPTALDDDIYLIPGGAGQIFGGKQSIATYVGIPKTPDTTRPESSFDIEKANFDYAYTKGRYSKKFTNGKYVDFSLEYRKTAGYRLSSDDNSYQYTGSVLMPISEAYTFRFTGNTLRRKSSFIIEPDFSISGFDRNRTDRNAEFSIEKHNIERSVKYSAGYLYQKQKSYIDGSYRGRFHYHNDGFMLKRESVHDNYMVKAEIDGKKLMFKNGFEDFDRYTVRPSLSILKTSGTSHLGVISGFEYMKTYKFLPFASLVYNKDTRQSLLYLSVGYSEKAPSLYELHLPYQQSQVYGGGIDYADSGNKKLGSEKQLTGTATVQFGDADNHLNISVTGGKIFNGIDWYDYDTTISGTSLKLFTPQNSDFTFSDISVTPKFQFLKLFTATLGGAYHIKDYERREQLAYSPEYNMFANIEMHIYWEQKLLDLYGYGEVTYSGPYIGYNGDILGEIPVLNFGISAELGSFRFHYIFLNSTQQVYSVREGNQILGRYTYYGFTWNFLD